MSHISPPSTLPPGSIVDAYVRDSGGPRQEASTDQQITEIESYCQLHGLVLRNKFQDVAKSGGSTVSRDDFNRLIDVTRHPQDRPHGILLWNYARFARDLDDAIYYKALLRNRNVIVHSLTDPVPEGQYGRIIEFFIDISNEEKRRQTSTDAKRGLKDLFLKHRCVPGTPPRGFKREPVEIGRRRDGTPHIAHKWVPDPKLVSRVKRAFEMRASGSSLAQIHDQLKLYGSQNSYKTFFANKIYIGIMEFGDEVIDDYCEPFVDMTTWNIVQKLIRDYAQARTPERHPRRAVSTYLLSGLIYCDICGAPMSGSTTTRNYITGRDEAYRCSRSKRRAGCEASRIARSKVEEAVISTLREYILLPESLSAIFEIENNSVNHREEKRAERLGILAAEKKSLAQKIINITRAIADRGHSQTLLEKLTELESQLTLVKTEFIELSNTKYHKAANLTELDITSISEKIISILAEAKPEETRHVLKSFVHQVRVKKKDGQITGSITYYTPPMQATGTSPPFELALTDGIMLPIGLAPVGAHLYRQQFSHPIIVPTKKTT